LSGDGAPAQRLLLPLTLDFAPASSMRSTRIASCWRIGYEIEPFRPQHRRATARIPIRGSGRALPPGARR